MIVIRTYKKAVLIVSVWVLLPSTIDMAHPKIKLDKQFHPDWCSILNYTALHFPADSLLIQQIQIP
ncbi:MAG: hypothetical protein CVU11_02340 [Bacteroidetes bacterium HGW-Bacteroidetes-6]|nr:MAG: hypothetical protein CVU11_02340 [Bacteroidetes bacterium HGW-Bacteroidetes-6]